MPRLNFTLKALKALPSPPAGRVIYSDAQVAGLRLYVTPTARVFYLNRWIQGRAEAIRLGRFPDDLDVEGARAEAEKLIGKIAGGVDPAEEKRMRRGEITVGGLFDLYMKRHVEPYRKPLTVSHYQGLYDKHLAKPLANRRLSTLTRREVQRLHAEVGKETGPYAANRVASLLRAMIEKARAWGYFAGENPAIGVERFKETSRERFAQANELPKFFKALAEEQDTAARDCILLALLTGARKRDVFAMAWADVDLDLCVWRLPDSKSGAQTIPLVAVAVQLLKERKRQNERDDEPSPWVFPSERSASGHLEEIRRAWERVKERSKLGDLRLHDLRRTLGSWQTILGASLSIVGRSLGHKSAAATAVYSRLTLDPVRASMEDAVSRILQEGGVIDAGKVTPIWKAKGKKR